MSCKSQEGDGGGGWGERSLLAEKKLSAVSVAVTCASELYYAARALSRVDWFHGERKIDSKARGAGVGNLNDSNDGFGIYFIDRIIVCGENQKFMCKMTNSWGFAIGNCC